MLTKYNIINIIEIVLKAQFESTLKNKQYPLRKITKRIGNYLLINLGKIKNKEAGRFS